MPSKIIGDMPLYELTEVKKTFFGEVVDTKVLHGISFTIQKGEFLSVMGPSGSGKSTLLHILGFLDTHTDGEIFFEGKNCKEYTEEEVAHLRNAQIGFVFQQFNLLPRQTIFDNVRLPLQYSDMPESMWQARVEEVVEMVGLTHRLSYEAYKLSGGEKQRVAIARALVNKPSVIFADEPTGNLDSKSGQAIMEILQKLHDELGHTVILITHESFTAEHADRIIHITDGLVASDTKVKVRRDAKTSFLK